MKVSAIIVTYNRLNYLKECLKCLEQQNYRLSKIVIINNNSDDGTTDYLNNLENNLYIIKNLTKNLGGAGGFSEGIKVAVEQTDSDLFWIMDDDTMPTNTSLNCLIDSVKFLNDDFGFLCSNVRWYKDGKSSYLNVPVTSKYWNDYSLNGLIKLKSASFVSFLTKREVIENVGLPISEMFIWADDVEYSTRISRKYPSYFVENSKVIHKCKTNSVDDSIINCAEHRIFYYECMFRNRMYIYRKYYPSRKIFTKSIYFLLYILKIVSNSNSFKLKRIKSVLFGVVKGIFFNPRIRYPQNKK